MKRNVYDKITQNIIDAMERGVVPWRRPWTVTAAPPANLVTRRPYRGINALSTWSAGYASPWWLGWCQVQHLGGRIRRGEHATTIVFFRLLESKSDSAEHDEPAPDDKEMAEGDEHRIPLVRYSHIWNIAQTEGLESHVPKSDDTVIVEPHVRAEALMAVWRDKPPIRSGFRRASYAPRQDEIRMPPREDFLNGDGYYATLFHECVHSTGHPRRLGRFQPDLALPPFGSEDYSREELVAELGAAFLCGAVGLEVEIESSAAYLAAWLSVLQKDRQMLVSAAAQAQRAADYIEGVQPIDADQKAHLADTEVEAQPA